MKPDFQPANPNAAQNIHEAIAAVMGEVGYVRKTKSAGLNYSYAGEAALIEALRPAMVEHGLYSSVLKVEDMKRDAYTTSKGNQMIVTRLVATVRFMHAPSLSFVDVQAVGEGADPGDKSANKAMTGAYKYALRQTFCIETGDDPDKDASEERSSGAVSEARQRPAAAPAGLPETGGPQGQGDGQPRKGEGSYSTPEDAEYPHCHKCGKEVTTTRKAGENAQRPGELFYSCWSKDGCKNGFIIYCDEWEKVKAGRKAKIIAGDFTPASKESQPKAADPDYSLFEKRGLVKCPHCDSVMMNVESDKLTEQGWEPSAIRENRYWACVQEDCVAAHNGDFRSWAKKPGGDK